MTAAGILVSPCRVYRFLIIVMYYREFPTREGDLLNTWGSFFWKLAAARRRRYQARSKKFHSRSVEIDSLITNPPSEVGKRKTVFGTPISY